jgi:hypothetical protein
MTSTFSASLEHWPLDRLIPHARNAQTHSEDQVGQIAGSIAEFGFVNPILVGATLLSKIPAVWRHHNLGALFGHHESFVQGNGVPGQL